VSAFAQSTVTLSGNFDVAYTNVGFSDVARTNTTTIQRAGATVSSLGTASTSNITINALEDMGGGLKAQAYYEIDPRVGLVDGGTSSFSAHSHFVGISGNFGAIKLGSIDSAAVIANGQQSALGTGVGSGYGILQSNVIAPTRYNRAVKFESAVYNGVSGSVYYAPGIQSSGVSTIEYAGLPMQRKTLEVGLAYANGPLAASLVNVATGSSDASTAVGTVAPMTTTAAVGSTSTTILTAKYELGANTFYAGYNKGQTIGTAQSASGLYWTPGLAAGLDTTGTRLGYKYTAGAWDFIASMNKQKIATANPATAYQTRKVTGFRVVNNLSKTTAAYVGYEGYNTGTDLAQVGVDTMTVAANGSNATATGANGGKYTLVSVGIKKAF
jgi:predicted porin